MQDSQNLRLFFNGLLICITTYSMFNYLPEYPYAFAACAFALCHGLLGVIQTLQQAEDNNAIMICSNTIMDVIPLTLVNIELYLDSESKAFAPLHYVFLLPLAIELMALLLTEDEASKAVQVLKDLAIVGNILSLLCLTCTEDNFLFGTIALMAIFIKYGKNWIASIPDRYTLLAGTTLFYSVTALYFVDLKKTAIMKNMKLLKLV